MSPGPHEFRTIVYSFYEKEGRTFPWRENTSPWGIVLSEFMLQQTQTARALEYWKRWMEKWPRPEDLHRASLEEALREWSGLGYNRRGKYLKDCASIITENYCGKVPSTPEKLALFPGIGPYTAGAIACFAYNYPAVFIETNIRSLMLHFFFRDKETVKDSDILPIIRKTLDRENPRKWYWALMDFGAALKRLSPNPSRRSAHYRRQSGFEGSFRQLRGSLIRSLLTDGPGDVEVLRKRIVFSAKDEDLYLALEALKKECFVAEKDGVYRIQDS
jgi:A/G-specific adenine glycosylase